jgi:hypothetical protein
MMKKQSKTDWERVDVMKAEDIDYSDIPEVGDDLLEKSRGIKMKPAIRLCDFYHIFEEREESGKLVVVGILDPLQDLLDLKKDAIVATFRTEQGGLKGGWWTMDYERVTR